MSVPLSDPELDRNKAILARRGAVQGAQIASLLAPPLYFANAAFRTKTWSINGLLRAQAVAVVLAGPPLGALYAQVRMSSYKTREDVLARVRLLALDSAHVQRNDYSVIGAAVGSLFTTAILLRRARTIWLLLGGAGMGLAGGVLTHVATEWQTSRPAHTAGAVDTTAGSKALK